MIASHIKLLLDFVFSLNAVPQFVNGFQIGNKTPVSLVSIINGTRYVDFTVRMLFTY